MGAGDWWDRTWNPFIGCSHKRTGCKNCWAERWAHRLAGGSGPAAARYSQVVKDGRWNGQVVPNIAEAPTQGLHSKIIAVNFMGDLFHPNVTDAQLDQVFEVIEHTTRHTFVLVTKRVDRMADTLQRRNKDPFHYMHHVWALATASCQSDVHDVIVDLLDCSPYVAHVGLHLEPLVGPVDLQQQWGRMRTEYSGTRKSWSYEHLNPTMDVAEVLDWIVVGGENGVGARPMIPEWVTSLHAQAKESDMPMWMKGWGPKQVDPPEWVTEIRKTLYPQELPT